MNSSNNRFSIASPMIEIVNVSMRFPVPRRYKEYVLQPFRKPGYVLALDNVNLRFEDGDKVAFLGPNGAGKTTLLKLIGGLLYPSAGYIALNGLRTDRANLEARREVGYILNEERSFYWRLTGSQNLEFFGALENLPAALLRTRIISLTKLVGLEKAIHLPVSGYSSGMKQRLAIARGLLGDPRVLIMDEPTRTLDPLATEDIRNLVYEKIHVSKSRILLIATHSLDEARQLCNKVCVINQGRILTYGDTEKALGEFGNLDQFYRYHMNKVA